MPDDDAKKLAEGRIGRVLKGKYRLDRVLGVGGMAVVYAATHRNKKRVAIKVLHPELSHRENVRTRFLREGYVANSVDHPGAVAVLDDDVAEDGSAFVVMEYLDGATVEELAARHGGRVPLALAVSIGDALLGVLAAAHGNGIVHRDVKPANLFVTSDGQLRVLDFGIARLHDETDTGATQPGAMLGTPAYMAPELARAEPGQVDAQSDVWAAGATLFVLLTGELVHEGENASQLLIAAGTRPARSMASVAPDVPKGIAEVIDRALAFAKGDRWASAEEMRDALGKAYVATTGGPVSALPKAEKVERVTGLEQTIASFRDVTPGSSGVGFEPTVEAVAPATRSVVSAHTGHTGHTGLGMAATRPSEPAAALERKRRWAKAGVAALACVALGAGVGAYRAVHAPRVRYCLSYDETNDGPRCVFEVGADILHKRDSSVPRITERGGRVTLLERVNFAGRLGSAWEKFARMEVVRDDTGAVRELVMYDRFGAIVEWQKWSDGGRRIDFVDIDGKTLRHLRQEDREESRVTTERVEYDAQGRQKRLRFFGPTGRPRAFGGSFGIAYDYGKTPGVVAKETLLGADGTVGPDRSGVAFTRHTDDGSLWGDRSSFDVDDRPIAPDGVHTWRAAHNDYDTTGTSCFGLRGEPVTSLAGKSGSSFHEARVAWDPDKRIWEWTNFDEQGRPQFVKASGLWGMRRTYDERGRSVLVESLDAHGNRVITGGGSAVLRFGYDDRDRRILLEELDPSGAPMQGDWGFARLETKPDAHDNHLEDRAYDEAGHIAAWRDGGGITRATYDERDLQLTWASFDASDHPVATIHGFSSEHLKYDRLRNLIEHAYFGPDGRPTVSDEGFATKRFTYDENDDLVAVSYFDASGAPTLFGGAYATQSLKNDERGLVVEEDYLDGHGDPALVKDGYASVRSTRDRNGDVVAEAYFGKHGEPVVREGGFAVRKTTFDVTRRPIEVALFDAAGRPQIGTAGWAVERTTYDERGLVVRVDHLDARKTPVLDRDGRASVTKGWDSRGNLTEQTSLDVAGKPVATSDGYAAKKTTYDDQDEVIEESLFGADGKPVSGSAGWSLRRVRYDEFGDVVEEAFFDGAHEPVVPKEPGFASVRHRYDERHRRVESAYFDVRGAPSKGPDGAATVRVKLDNYGRAIETGYFDGMGAPAPSQDGRVVVRSTYDDAGHLVDERFVDSSGAPRAAVDGCSGHHTKYDVLGHELERACLDAKDSATLSTEGWALRRTLHDARGNDVEVATYAPDGTLHPDRDGIALRRNRFDERNLLLETTFFDAQDRPARDKRGAHALRYTYDDSGKKTSETALDERDHAVPVKR
jgi:YD repeat-containing protein